MKRYLKTLLLAAALLPGAAAFSQNEDPAMAAYMAAMTPGPEHEWMSKMAGEFNYVMRTFEAGQPSPDSPGSSRGEMVLGGRYLRESMNGEVWGMPFEGHNVLAFDNVTQTYHMSWIDNQGTGIMTGKGKRKGNVLSINCPSTDPVSKQPMTYRCVTTVLSDSQHKYEMFQKGKKGPEVKFMEIVYTRK